MTEYHAVVGYVLADSRLIHGCGVAAFYAAYVKYRHLYSEN